MNTYIAHQKVQDENTIQGLDLTYPDSIVRTVDTQITLGAMPQSLIVDPHQFGSEWALDSWIPQMDRPPFPMYEMGIDNSDTQPLANEQNKKNATIPELIEHIENSDLYFSKKISQRLSTLYVQGVFDYPDVYPMLPQSLQTFSYFVFALKDLVLPKIYLTPKGEIRAEWSESDRKHCAITFLEDNEFRFVIFSTDSNDPSKVSRISGNTTFDNLKILFTTYHAFDWICLSNRAAA